MTLNKLKFLMDVGVGNNVESYLKKQGYDVKTIRSIDPHMKDHNIIRLAFAEKRMVVTMDKDFGELVYHSRMDHCGVLLLRLEEATGAEKVEVVSYIMEHYADRIFNHFCVFQNNKLRIRKLPVIK